MTRLIGCLLGLCLLWLSSEHLLAARTLVINANTSDPAPRAAWEAAVAQFRSENPDIEVKLNIYRPRELQAGAAQLADRRTARRGDVVRRPAHARIGDPGLFEDVSELFTPQVKASFHRAAVDNVTVEGRQYGVAFTQYHWGLYFRRDILSRAGLRDAPRDWDELLQACETLRAAGFIPSPSARRTCGRPPAGSTT
jgi:multiple sugar transport system substrate-binding protein